MCLNVYTYTIRPFQWVLRTLNNFFVSVYFFKSANVLASYHKRGAHLGTCMTPLLRTVLHTVSVTHASSQCAVSIGVHLLL
jgi:hypothetical protein